MLHLSTIYPQITVDMRSITVYNFVDKLPKYHDKNSYLENLY